MEDGVQNLHIELVTPPPNQPQYSLKNDYPLVCFLLIMSIIIGWILVNLWTRCIENVAYVTFKLDINSSWHTFIVAMTVTIIAIGYILMLQSYQINVNSSIVPPLDSVRQIDA
jgi:hypothetical protein